jgi:hypothetical protein
VVFCTGWKWKGRVPPPNFLPWRWLFLLQISRPPQTFIVLNYARIIAWNFIFELLNYAVKVLRLFSVGNRYVNVSGVEWSWRGKIEGLGEKPIPVPLCPQRQVPFRMLRFPFVNKLVLIVCLFVCLFAPLVHPLRRSHLWRSIKLSSLPRQLLPNHATLFLHGQTYTNVKIMFTVNLSSQYMVPPSSELVLWGSYFLIIHCRGLLLTHRIHIYTYFCAWYWHASPSSDRLLRNRRQ